ncbi:MAG: hypothetical protein WC549_09425 [Actinomycetota bacterium]
MKTYKIIDHCGLLEIVEIDENGKHRYLRKSYNEKSIYRSIRRYRKLAK